MASISYDVIVIGSGSAGFSAAFAARGLGASVLMVEKKKFGGECPNYACVPTKALLKCAKMYQKVRNAGSYGIEAQNVSFDFEDIMAYRKKVVETITGGGELGDRYVKLSEENEITTVIGTAKFIDEHVIEVDGQAYVGKAFVVATGTVDFIPPIQGLSQVPYITFREAVTLERQPRKMAVIGGGPVGTELATFFAMIGTRVVLFQGAETILNREDPEIAALAQKYAGDNGIEVMANAKVVAVKEAQGGVYGLTVETGGKTITQAVDSILVATGKRAATDGLGLEEVGVKLDKRGSIKTGVDQQTSKKHIFAAGDVDGGFMFTHTAHYEGSVAGYNAARSALKKRNEKKTVDMRVVPRVTFVDPEVASVGMTAAEVKEKFGSVLVGRFHTGGLGRRVTEQSKPGLVKIVAHPKTRKILGGHIISDRAGEMIHQIAMAMQLKASVDKIAEMIHAFPTYSEAVSGAASAVVIE